MSMYNSEVHFSSCPEDPFKKLEYLNTRAIYLDFFGDTNSETVINIINWFAHIFGITINYTEKWAEITDGHGKTTEYFQIMPYIPYANNVERLNAGQFSSLKMALTSLDNVFNELKDKNVVVGTDWLYPGHAEYSYY